jgi:hypothetical protein
MAGSEEVSGPCEPHWSRYRESAMRKCATAAGIHDADQESEVVGARFGACAVVDLAFNEPVAQISGRLMIFWAGLVNGYASTSNSVKGATYAID